MKVQYSNQTNSSMMFGSSLNENSTIKSNQNDTTQINSRIYPSPCSSTVASSNVGNSPFKPGYQTHSDAQSQHSQSLVRSNLPPALQVNNAKFGFTSLPTPTNVPNQQQPTMTTPVHHAKLFQQMFPTTSLLQSTMTPPAVNLSFQQMNIPISQIQSNNSNPIYNNQVTNHNISVCYNTGLDNSKKNNKINSINQSRFQQQYQQQQPINENQNKSETDYTVVKKRYQYTQSKIPTQNKNKQSYHPYSNMEKNNHKSLNNPSKLRIVTGFTTIQDFNRYVGMKTYLQYADILCKQFFFSSLIASSISESSQKRLIWPSTRMFINGYYNSQIYDNSNDQSSIMQAYIHVRDRIAALLSVSQVNAITIYLASYYINKIQEIWVSIKNKEFSIKNSDKDTHLTERIQKQIEELMSSQFNSVSGGQCITQWYAFIVSTLIIANKTLEDHTFKNSTWSVMAKCDCLTLNKFERIILSAFNFDCYLGKCAFEIWCRYLDEQSNNNNRSFESFVSIYNNSNTIIQKKKLLLQQQHQQQQHIHNSYRMIQPKLILPSSSVNQFNTVHQQISTNLF